jgi:hypothetical protein
MHATIDGCSDAIALPGRPNLGVGAHTPHFSTSDFRVEYVEYVQYVEYGRPSGGLRRSAMGEKIAADTLDRDGIV